MGETYVVDTGEARRLRGYSVVVGSRLQNDSVPQDCDYWELIGQAVLTASQKGGGTVVIRSGTYRSPYTPMPITIPAGVVVMGEGDGTVIVQPPGLKVFILNGGTLENLKIDASGGGPVNPVDMNLTGSFMENVTIVGSTATDVVRVLDVVRGGIRNCTILLSGGIAINVVPVLALNSFIIENTSIDIVGLGIRVSGNVSRLSIESCEIGLTVSHGIHVITGDRVNITENKIALCGGDGIRVDTANNNIMNNESNQNGGFGINMTGTSTRNVCSSNTVRANVLGFIQDLSNPGTNELVHYQL